MALEEAKAMGLDLMPDPETFSNAPRDHQTNNQRAKYLYDSNLPEDWGSTASESGDDLDNLNDDAELAQYMLETGGLTDREIDRLDGKTSSRLGVRDSTVAGGVGAGPNGQKNYPERETGANTGPKGVLADQKYHQQQQLQERLSTQQAYNARMIAKAPTTTTFREDQARERREKKAQGLLDSDEEAALDADNEKEDAEERAILERIRGNRLKDMSWAAQKTGGNTALAGKKVFGSLMEMNAAQYVSAIDSEKKDVTVVIHIYSEFNPASKKLDGCLIQLAGRYATTKFIRIKAREVDFDEEVCPTVLVYRAGDLIANLVMISYELSEDFDSAELEELLTK
ncbi:MAG: thioredoxin-like protein [Linnemannia gamsii]|nr:MAG: thioredoxin-like protein [Linnemannia gamsii]